MAIELIAKIAPKNDGFVGMVDADQVLGGGPSGTLPDACVAESNITQHEAAINAGQVDGLDGADLVQNTLFDANTILKADSDDTPAALTVAEQTLVGRITSGVIAALTATQVRTLLNVADGADVTLTSTIAAKYRTRGATYYETPVLATKTIVVKRFEYAATLIKVIHETESDTATWMLKIRTDLDAAGTDVFADPVVSTTTEQTETSFEEDAIPAGAYLVLVPTSKTGAPDWLAITPVWTID